MKNTKRFLSLFLALALVFTMAISVSAEETQDAAASNPGTVTLSDIDPNTAVGKAVNKLVSVGIINGYEDGTYRPDNTITRAEFAKVIAVFLGLGEFASDAPSGFSDVDGNDHWAKKYIKLAVDKGIVLGYEDGTFRPDNPVKYSEAIKMVVCALGYGNVATRRTVEGAPWYSGYVTLAGELKLLTNTAINNYEDEASRGNVAVIIYNALDVEVANTTTSSTGKTSTSSSGKTAQETFLKSKDMKGIVVSCYQTSLSKVNSSNKERFINVDDGEEVLKYRVPDGTDTYALLGYEIEANVDDDDSVSDFKDITSIKKTKNNEVKTIKPEDISSITSSSIKYWSSDSATKATTINFDKSMVVIYNGRYLGTMDEVSADEFDIKAGTLVFVSNDGDSKPDVAFINNCEVFAVSSAGTDSASKLKKIYTLYGGGDILVPDNGTVIKINNKGTTVQPGDSYNLAKYDVINLYRSKDGEVFDMTVTKNKVSGTITEVASDGTITINKKEYKIAYNLDNYTGDDKPSFTRNTSANVYTDVFGNIAAAEKLSTVEGTNINIGYLIKVGKESSIDAKCEASLYGLAGKTGQLGYQMASKVKIDGTSYSDAADIMDALRNSASIINDTKLEKKDSWTKNLTITDYNQLIRYTLNSKGEIDTIDTNLPNVNEATDDLKVDLIYPNNSDARYEGDTWDGRYKYVSGNVFQGEGDKNIMGVNSQTKVLVIPEDMSDREKYRVSSYSYFSNSQFYRVEGYNFNATNVAAYVLVYAGKDSTGFTYNSDIAITKAVTQASSSSSSELEDKLVGWNLKNGNDISNLRSEADILFGNVTAGEIMRYTLDDGKVDKIEMVLEKGEGGLPVLFSGNKGMNALDAVDSADAAKAQRTVQYDADSRSATASVCKLVYGTVLAKESENNTNSITLTSTVATDTCGIDDNDKQLFTMDANTKYFVIDFTQSKEDDIASSDVQFDEIRSLKDVEGDVYEASQVLLFYNAGKIKTVVIVKANYGVG